MRSSPVCPEADRRQRSFPCSPARWPRLPSWFFQVCAFSFSPFCCHSEQKRRISGRFFGDPQTVGQRCLSLLSMTVLLRLCSEANQLSTLTYQPSTFGSLRFKRSHVDGETVFHIGLEQSLVSFIDFLYRNHFDVSRDVIGAAKVEHLLCFGDAADGRASETAASHDETECRNSQWFRRGADHGKISVAAEQI